MIASKFEFFVLFRFHFIRADHVLKLRRLLERLLPEMSGLTTGEKDPEELLNALFNTVLRVEPFLFMRLVLSFLLSYKRNVFSSKIRMRVQYMLFFSFTASRDVEHLKLWMHPKVKVQYLEEWTFEILAWT